MQGLNGGSGSGANFANGAARRELGHVYCRSDCNQSCLERQSASHAAAFRERAPLYHAAA